MKRQKNALLNQIGIAGKNIQYDEQVKRVLSDKIILAWILKYSIHEFKNSFIEEIERAIEGTPEISVVPVYPGKTPEMITGMATEDKIPNEGEVRYDIRFAVFTPAKERVKLIVNIEAQKKYYPGYDLVTRAIFYCARMLSSQVDTEFSLPDYDGIKKVYSIWICMNVPDYAKNTITGYRIQPENICGEFKGKARYDLLSAVMICLGNARETSGDNPLIDMLSVLLSDKMGIDEKETCLHDNFGIETSVEMKEGLTTMCNLSYGIAEEAEQKGREEGREKLILQCLQSGKTCEQIAAFIGISLDEVRDVEKKFLQTTK